MIVFTSPTLFGVSCRDICLHEFYKFYPFICYSSFDTVEYPKKMFRPILPCNSCLRYTVWIKHMCWLSELTTKAHNIGKSWKIYVCPLYQGCLRIRVVHAGSCLIGGDHGNPMAIEKWRCAEINCTEIMAYEGVPKLSGESINFLYGRLR